MKSILNALTSFWALLGLAFFAAIAIALIKFAADGAMLLRMWAWLLLAAVATLAVAMSLLFKSPRYLTLIPMFSIPLFLAGGLSENLGTGRPEVQNEVQRAPAGVEPTKVSEEAEKMLGKFFGN